MTENEAIEALKLEGGIEIAGNPRRIAKFFEALDMAISALKEIQQYREIGTVEECREAREKQKMKKSIDYDEDLGYFKCPSCGCCIMADEFSDHKYCLNCGQAIQWKESEEE